MPQSSFFRLFQRAGFLSALLFLATLGLAAGLAWQAARAEASHRAAVEVSLNHHAAIAAWRFAREGRSWLDYGMNEAGTHLYNEIVQRADLPGPDVLQKVLAEKECDCMTAGFGRTFFRLTPDREPKIVFIGEPLSERASESLILTASRALVDTTRRPGRSRWGMLPAGEPHLTRPIDVALLWKIDDPNRGIHAVYGMIVEAAQIQRPLRGALDNAQFFPPSIVPEKRADSLVRIVVAGPNRQPVFETGPNTNTFTGTDTLGARLGGFTVTASIDPAAAPLLMGGEVPSSRVPTIIGMLAVTLGVGAAALLLLRREHRLARLREDFVSGVSHELRTPLTQIRMLSELLQSDGFHTDAERARARNIIHREALRLTNLVDNILEFSRLRRTSTIGATARVALAEVVRELADSFAPLLDAQNNRLELDIAADVEVAGDRDAVNRVLRNLVENAVKYGPQGQTIRMTLSPADPPNAARVTVDDQGAGIPAEERARIWQPYYRLERDRNAAAGGSGIGLSVVADLMRAIGGRAWVADAPGGGARFAVEFPGASVQSRPVS